MTSTAPSPLPARAPFIDRVASLLGDRPRSGELRGGLAATLVWGDVDVGTGEELWWLLPDGCNELDASSRECQRWFLLRLRGWGWYNRDR